MGRFRGLSVFSVARVLSVFVTEILSFACYFALKMSLGVFPLPSEYSKTESTAAKTRDIWAS